MEQIPCEVLINILKYLTISEIFASAIAVSVDWRLIVNSPYLLQFLVKREYNLRFYPNTPGPQSYRILKALKKEPKLLEFFGFITNGGVDENLMRFWCINLFRSSGEAYCAHDDSENCNVGGVLLDCLVDPRTYFNSENSVRSSMESFVNGEVLDPFQRISLRKAMELLGMKALHGHLISQLENIAIVIPTLSEVKRYPENHYILQHNIELSHSENSQFFAVVKQLKISRMGHYTCPVKSLFVFISDKFLDVTNEVFSLFNNVKKFKDLAQLIANDPTVPDVHKRFKGNHVQYCEFLPSVSLEIMPIVWVKFHGNSVKINLSHNFTGKYLYVKLVHQDDHREGRHQGMNIDCSHVLPFGHIINLGTEYHK